MNRGFVACDFYFFLKHIHFKHTFLKKKKVRKRRLCHIIMRDHPVLQYTKHKRVNSVDFDDDFHILKIIKSQIKYQRICVSSTFES